MTETIEDLQARNQALEHQLLQQKVGHLAGLPDDISSRLKGDDERSMMQDAELFIDWIKPKTKPIVAPLKSTEPIIKKKNSFSDMINKLNN